ncbi:hypothetical protein PNH38_04295 [Anoxybacillus rupiensis]|uniref:Uncharacterized protein n=1 Tax=Anoxybacteroides rupiense TaxID=311460 RepID=A0ABT5W193_9BACL|nr:hypothetical protein [Anoxybacillus rupiensis]
MNKRVKKSKKAMDLVARGDESFSSLHRDNDEDESDVHEARYTFRLSSLKILSNTAASDTYTETHDHKFSSSGTRTPLDQRFI